MEPYRHVKILATVGPACDSIEMLAALISAGADGFRLNASHGKPAQLREWIPKIRAAEERTGKYVALLLDLPGPKLRVGELPAEGIALSDGETVTLVPVGAGGGIPAGEWSLLQQVKPGEPILLFDGRIRLEAVECRKERIEARVLAGGTVFTRKGINLPGTLFDLPDLLPQDIAALDAVAADADWVALSFVRSAGAGAS